VNLRGYLQIPTTGIEQEIRTSHIIENFLFGGSEALTADVPLLGNAIDSTGVIELIVYKSVSLSSWAMEK
jgi:hypothetical protein